MSIKSMIPPNAHIPDLVSKTYSGEVIGSIWLDSIRTVLWKHPQPIIDYYLSIRKERYQTCSMRNMYSTGGVG